MPAAVRCQARALHAGDRMAVGTVGCDQYTEIHFVTEAVRRTCRIVYRVVAAKRTASNMGPRYYLVPVNTEASNGSACGAALDKLCDRGRRVRFPGQGLDAGNLADGLPTVVTMTRDRLPTHELPLTMLSCVLR